MYTINEDLSIYATRGDIVAFSVTAEDNGENYKFQPGDVVRIKVYGKKDAESVVLQKEFPVFEEAEEVEIFLSEQDTKIGEVISKPRDYWYEVELNPYNNPQTIIGYDEDGAKVFKLFPEGDDIPEYVPDPEDVKVIDEELDLTSPRPVENRAIARAITQLNAAQKETANNLKEQGNTLRGNISALDSELTVERARIDNLVSGATADGSEVADGRVGHDANTWAVIGNNIRANGKFGELLASAVDMVAEKVDATIINGWVGIDGEYRSNASTGDTHKCVQINVIPGEQYLIYSEYGWNMPDAVAQGTDGTMVRYFHSSENAKAVNDFDSIITIPDGAQKLTVNCMSLNGKPLTVAKIVGCRSKVTENYLANALSSVKSGESKYGANLIKSTKTAHALKFGAEFEVESGDTQFSVGECAVEEGKTYHIKAGASFMSNPYLFFSESGILVGKMLVAPSDGYRKYDMDVIAPPGAVLLKVGQYGGETPEVHEVIGHIPVLEWSGLKWVCVGDSLTEENIRTTKHYFDYIAEKTGIFVVNMGVGGTGYKRGEDRNLAIYQRIEDVPADADVVTIFGSGNDVSLISTLGKVTDTGTDTICGCVNTTINKLYEINPTMQIGIISPTPWIYHEPDNKSGMTVYATALKDICELQGIPFLDLLRCSGFRPNDEAFRDLVYSKDDGNGVHPNELGHKIIAPRIKRFLENFIL